MRAPDLFRSPCVTGTGLPSGPLHPPLLSDAARLVGARTDIALAGRVAPVALFALAPIHPGGGAGLHLAHGVFGGAGTDITLAGFPGGGLALLGGRDSAGAEQRGDDKRGNCKSGSHGP